MKLKNKILLLSSLCLTSIPLSYVGAFNDVNNNYEIKTNRNEDIENDDLVLLYDNFNDIPATEMNRAGGLSGHPTNAITTLSHPELQTGDWIPIEITSNKNGSLDYEGDFNGDLTLINLFFSKESDKKIYNLESLPNVNGGYHAVEYFIDPTNTSYAKIVFYIQTIGLKPNTNYVAAQFYSALFNGIADDDDKIRIGAIFKDQDGNEYKIQSAASSHTVESFDTDEYYTTTAKSNEVLAINYSSSDAKNLSYDFNLKIEDGNEPYFWRPNSDFSDITSNDGKYWEYDTVSTQYEPAEGNEAPIQDPTGSLPLDLETINTFITSNQYQIKSNVKTNSGQVDLGEEIFNYSNENLSINNDEITFDPGVDVDVPLHLKLEKNRSYSNFQFSNNNGVDWIEIEDAIDIDTEYDPLIWSENGTAQINDIDKVINVKLDVTSGGTYQYFDPKEISFKLYDENSQLLESTTNPLTEAVSDVEEVTQTYEWEITSDEAFEPGTTINTIKATYANGTEIDIEDSIDFYTPLTPEINSINDVVADLHEISFTMDVTDSTIDPTYGEFKPEYLESITYDSKILGSKQVNDEITNSSNVYTLSGLESKDELTNISLQFSNESGIEDYIVTGSISTTSIPVVVNSVSLSNEEENSNTIQIIIDATDSLDNPDSDDFDINKLSGDVITIDEDSNETTSTIPSSDLELIDSNSVSYTYAMNVQANSTIKISNLSYDGVSLSSNETNEVTTPTKDVVENFNDVIISDPIEEETSVEFNINNIYSGGEYEILDISKFTLSSEKNLENYEITQNTSRSQEELSLNIIINDIDPTLTYDDVKVVYDGVEVFELPSFGVEPINDSSFPWWIIIVIILAITVIGIALLLVLFKKKDDGNGKGNKPKIISIDKSKKDKVIITLNQDSASNFIEEIKGRELEGMYDGELFDLPFTSKINKNDQVEITLTGISGDHDIDHLNFLAPDKGSKDIKISGEIHKED